ncbi:uncharacterized protein LOC135388209 isoform X2 [Ornithodoros turicata]|uniref:uncharacterized protein LOC135388209 isoform X2 n=1 Tax=Ornithodoros turicata TaxID=34597 RepID=UPI00313A068D
MESPDESPNSAECSDDEQRLRTYGLLGFRDLCIKKGFPNLRLLSKDDLAGLVKEFYEQSRIKQGVCNARSLRRFHLGLTQYFRSQFGSDFDMGRDPAFVEANNSFAAASKMRPSSKLPANMTQTADAVVISTEDLTKIGQYFWRVINTPRGLQQKVWFDLMIHLGAEGIENQHSMRRESFVILKSQTDGRRRLQWVEGKSRGAPVFDDPDSPLCPVKTFQLYLSKLNLACPALFQRPHDGITKSSRFWFHMFPLNNTMLALMMYDISKDAGLSRVYPNFCTQVLPEKGRFYQLARTGYLSLENFCAQPPVKAESPKGNETTPPPQEGDSIPFKLCAQCLTPVKLTTTAQKNKGILCSVPCFEAFMKAKEMRQNIKVSFKDGTRVPQYTMPGGANSQLVAFKRGVGGTGPPEQVQLLGKNIPPDVYKFIQQVAKIQAQGHPAKEGVPMLFKEDGSNIDAKDWSLPAELMELTMNIGKQQGNKQPVGSSLLQRNIKRIKMEPTIRIRSPVSMLQPGAKTVLQPRCHLVQKVPIQMIQKGQLIQKQTIVHKVPVQQKPPARPPEAAPPVQMQLKIEPVVLKGESGQQIKVQLKMQTAQDKVERPTLPSMPDTDRKAETRPSEGDPAKPNHEKELSPQTASQRRENVVLHSPADSIQEGGHPVQSQQRASPPRANSVSLNSQHLRMPSGVQNGTQHFPHSQQSPAEGSRDTSQHLHSSPKAAESQRCQNSLAHPSPEPRHSSQPMQQSAIADRKVDGNAAGSLQGMKGLEGHMHWNPGTMGSSQNPHLSSSDALLPPHPSARPTEFETHNHQGAPPVDTVRHMHQNSSIMNPVHRKHSQHLAPDSMEPVNSHQKTRQNLEALHPVHPGAVDSQKHIRRSTESIDSLHRMHQNLGTANQPMLQSPGMVDSQQQHGSHGALELQHPVRQVHQQSAATNMHHAADGKRPAVHQNQHLHGSHQSTATIQCLDSGKLVHHGVQNGEPAKLADTLHDEAFQPRLYPMEPNNLYGCQNDKSTASKEKQDKPSAQHRPMEPLQMLDRMSEGHFSHFQATPAYPDFQQRSFADFHQHQPWQFPSSPFQPHIQPQSPHTPMSGQLEAGERHKGSWSHPTAKGTQPQPYVQEYVPDLPFGGQQPFGQHYQPYHLYQPQHYEPQLLQQYSPFQQQHFPSLQHHLPGAELAAKLEIPNGM